MVINYEVYSTRFSRYGGNGHGEGYNNNKSWTQIKIFDFELVWSSNYESK